MNDKNAFQDLYERIDKKFNEELVITNEDEISLFELVETLKYAINPYNDKLITINNELVKHLNKRIRLNSLNIFSKKRIPLIDHISSIIKEDGDSLVNICFCEKEDNKSKYIGEANINSSGRIYVDLIRKNYSQADTMMFLDDSIMSFIYSFKTLSEFSNEYPGIAYEWNTYSTNSKNIKLKDEENPKKLEVTDDLLHAYIDLDRINEPIVTFKNSADLELSRTKSNKYGELYDYIDYFKNHYMKRMKVNINDLNDLYYQLYEHGLERKNEMLYGKDDEKVLKRVK